MRIDSNVFANEIISKNGKNVFTMDEIKEFASNNNYSIPTECKSQDIRVGKIGKSFLYDLSKITSTKDVKNNIVKEEIVVSEDKTNFNLYVPKKSSIFVPYGTNYKLINNVIKTSMFYPMYVWGVSGLGKTFQIEQACANSKRPLFRVQITKETTNEDLIGSYTLVNGNTIWMDGPVVMAYKSGGVLLLDEIDLNPSLMSLQVVLENKPIFIPQTGDLVYPEDGFTVFATGNTKGDGSDSRYVGTSVLNDAFLERFVTIIEQNIPTIEAERKMIDKYCENEGIEIDKDILDYFCKWIEIVREQYKEENTDVYISSRRIQYILKTYKLTGNFNKSIEIALSRYNSEEASAFFNAWKAIDANTMTN